MTLKQAARYMQGDEYGESKELNDLAQSADLAAGASHEDAPHPEVAAPRNPQLTDVTQRPDEPITAGVGKYTPPPQIPPQELADAVRAAYIARPGKYTLKMLEAIEAQNL